MVLVGRKSIQVLSTNDTVHMKVTFRISRMDTQNLYPTNRCLGSWTMSCGSAFILITWTWKSQRDWELAALIRLLACLVEAESLWVSSGLLQSCGREKCNLMHTREQWREYILQKFSKKALKTNCVKWLGKCNSLQDMLTTSQRRRHELARSSVVLCSSAELKLVLALAHHILCTGCRCNRLYITLCA